MSGSEVDVEMALKAVVLLDVLSFALPTVSKHLREPLVIHVH